MRLSSSRFRVSGPGPRFVFFSFVRFVVEVSEKKTKRGSEGEKKCAISQPSETSKTHSLITIPINKRLQLLRFAFVL